MPRYLHVLSFLFLNFYCVFNSQHVDRGILGHPSPRKKVGVPHELKKATYSDAQFVDRRVYDMYENFMTDLPLSDHDLSMIESMAIRSTGTDVESNGRRSIAVIYIKEGGSFEIMELFENFILNSQRNAPVFSASKLLVAALDDSSAAVARRLGHTNIIRIYNGSTSMSSSFKFRLIYSLLDRNISVLVMEADQVILRNPFEGLVGDCDIELSSDYPRPSLAFNDVYALDHPLGQPIREIADSANIGLMFMSPTLQVYCQSNNYTS